MLDSQAVLVAAEGMGRTRDERGMRFAKTNRLSCSVKARCSAAALQERARG